ncbi:MAG TPA: hypothetical protein DEV93_04465 [Chloroflexi bacterium]|nr:hypothetical protein [Chloroflexota bacterium]
MRLLLDENLPLVLANAFRIMRFDVEHVREHLPARSPDHEVVSLAKRLDAVIVTRDSTFHEQELVAQVLEAGGVAVITIRLPSGYEDFRAIRDVLWALLEDPDRIPVRTAAHILCTVRAPRPQKRRRGQPSLTFTEPGRRLDMDN